jgi:hypothetical protein
MSRRRLFTNEECAVLAARYEALQAMGTMSDWCKEFGCSHEALKDAILRGQGKDPGHVRRKIRELQNEVA